MRYLCRLTVEKDSEFIARMKTCGAVNKSVKRRNDKYFILNKELIKVLQNVETNFNFNLFCDDNGKFVIVSQNDLDNILSQCKLRKDYKPTILV